MKRAIASLRLIGPCLFVAGAAQYAVYHIRPGDYAERKLWLFMGGWGIGSLAMAWLERRLFFTFFGSVALSAPAISYSTLGHGGLEMGGFMLWLPVFGLSPSTSFLDVFAPAERRRKF